MAYLASSSAADEIDVGQRLREFRNDRGLSIRALAEMSGLNFNTLSLIENGKTSPSVSTLQQLAQALRIPVAAFFATGQPPVKVVCQQAGRRPQVAFDHGVLEDLGAGMPVPDVKPLLVTLEPGTDSGPDSIVHTGLEFVYCLAGVLRYVIEEQTYCLEPGDSLFFEAHLPHRWENVERVPVYSLLVLCPSDQNDQAAERHFATM
ncbi:MAG: cupin domain-containing protein [Anaerolineae bacterium]|nr:cupin domain-containing protein [Anaerolineae bacterium]